MSGSLPFRWRLTAWYGVILTCSFLLLGLGLYVGLRGLLLENFEEQLRKESDLAQANIVLNGTAPELDPVMFANLADDEHFVRLLAPDGSAILDTGPTVGAQTLDQATISEVLGGEQRILTVDANEEDYSTIVSPIKSGEEVVGLLQVGLSRGDIDETLRLVATVLAIATPIAVLIAVVGGYIIAGKAIAPVATITDLAAELDGADLHARLNLHLPDDELGRLAKTFDEMLGRIEQAFDRQRRFTGDAAHELRTPLTMMRGEVDLALRTPRTAEEYRAALVELDRDLDRMTGLVGSLLTLARSDERRITLDVASFDFAETITSISEQYRSQAIDRSIELKLDLQPSVIVNDEDRCIQILVNLLDNAFAHTPAGGTIEIGVNRRSDNVLFWVSDNGIGIAPEHRERVFDRFYRIDSGRSRDAGGSGLGLSICRALVESMGGAIELRSEIGKGTVVTVHLPISTQHQNAG